MVLRNLVVGYGLLGILLAQDVAPTPIETESKPWAERHDREGFVLNAGTRVPLSMINSVSTKHTAVGDRIYLETVFPILSDGRIVIPPGSYVAGTVTSVKRPGRVKGRGELYVRFDSLTLPNGVTRDFRARIGTLDGQADEELNREEGTIKSPGSKAGDARTVGEATAAGASAGTIAGAIGGNAGMGAGIGAAVGATAGLVGVLLSRGPDAMLTKGTTLEMILDRELVFDEEELNFDAPRRPRRYSQPVNEPPASERDRRKVAVPGARLPF